MAKHSDDALGCAVAAGALPALVAALRSTSHMADDFEGALCAVHYVLAAPQDALAGPLCSAGAVEAIASGLRVHPAHESVQRCACKLLFRLLHEVQLDAEAHEGLRRSGAVDAIVAAMRTKLSDDALQTVGCGALSAVRRQMDAPERWLEHSGYLDVVLAAMRTHRTSIDVHCCEMVRGNARHVAAAVAAGVPELILTALRAHPAAHILHINAYALLHILLTTGDAAPGVALARRLLAAGALQLAARPGGLASESREDVTAYLQAVSADAERAAERAAAELLAEEEAGRAAAKGKNKKSRSSKKKGGAAAAAAAGASGSVAGAASGSIAGAAEIDADDAAAAPDTQPAGEASAAMLRRRRRAATKATRRAGSRLPAATASTGVDGDSDDDSQAALPSPDTASAAPEVAAAAAAVPVQADAADTSDAAASDAQLLGDIFPWLHIAPVPAAATAAPALPPLSLHAQPPRLAPPQQTALELENAAMAAEVARLRAEADASKCPICLDAPKCTVLLPCRHLALCGAPACAAMLGAPPLCPLCREPVTDTLQLFV